MKIFWTSKALSDLSRLHEFLMANARLGESLDEFLPREVRRILVRQYEIRYEIKDTAIYILRVWHTREHR
ncbi:type II toxin-antitoxin system RelE/ParE family toxin [Duganella callida]|uniref:Type II toxin-antitoxin system RelE/ParE family toxin n=1 Tax=Duganella callida TaxID=2561932 RepID=A0A4Y9SQ95_9BURK|nr:type II toxin-antitoxin system RelE/ParE family toxin [Duganella callida]TFW26556.1 type II toxin-antitoxin system RelE/ParE family toxin [Duganella callida]